jgi:hypothetical protein
MRTLFDEIEESGFTIIRPTVHIETAYETTWSVFTCAVCGEFRVGEEYVSVGEARVCKACLAVL